MIQDNCDDDICVNSKKALKVKSKVKVNITIRCRMDGNNQYI